MKNRFVCAVLAFFLGDFGIDLFYRRKWFRGIMCVLFCWTLIPGFIGIIRCVRCLWMDSDEEFNNKMVNW